MQQRWPRRLWIVRHGESTGNVARQAAMDAGLSEINIDHRDIDVPLSALGEEQAIALGRWFARNRDEGLPEVVLTSPYARANRTAELICEHGGFADAEFIADERLREKEFGILDRLTTAGIQERFPDQARFRTLLGKFYHRPPAGESWCDVVLRLRSLMDTVGLHHGGQDVLIVSHQVVVLCLRYLLERLSEEAILAIIGRAMSPIARSPNMPLPKGHAAAENSCCSAIISLRPCRRMAPRSRPSRLWPVPRHERAFGHA